MAAQEAGGLCLGSAKSGIRLPANCSPNVKSGPSGQQARETMGVIPLNSSMAVNEFRGNFRWTGAVGMERKSHSHDRPNRCENACRRIPGDFCGRIIDLHFATHAKASCCYFDELGLPEEFAMKRVLAICLLSLGLGVNAEEGVVDKTGAAVERGAHAAANGVEHGVEAAGNGIKRGAEATAGFVKKGAEAAGHGIEVGLSAAGRGVKRGAEATGNALHKAAEKVTPSSSSSSDQ